MNSGQLNEHDAQQGAQSKGEFLGMTGNTVWYLLVAIGVSQMLLVFLWGMLGVSLAVCLGMGVTLCATALAYVFALKNNRPAHYDTDFFESALIEAGVLALAFGPSERRPPNPFRSAADQSVPAAKRGVMAPAHRRSAMIAANGCRSDHEVLAAVRPPEKPRREKEEAPTVPLAAYQRLREELNDAEERLEDATMTHQEDGLCA